MPSAAVVKGTINIASMRERQGTLGTHAGDALSPISVGCEGLLDVTI